MCKFTKNDLYQRIFCYKNGSMSNLFLPLGNLLNDYNKEDIGKPFILSLCNWFDGYCLYGTILRGSKKDAGLRHKRVDTLSCKFRQRKMVSLLLLQMSLYKTLPIPALFTIYCSPTRSIKKNQSIKEKSQLL